MVFQPGGEPVMEIDCVDDVLVDHICDRVLDDVLCQFKLSKDAIFTKNPDKTSKRVECEGPPATLPLSFGTYLLQHNHQDEPRFFL